MPIRINGAIYYRTAEVCAQVGISRSTLLRWISADIIKRPCRDRRGWRLFTEEDISKIKMEITRIKVLPFPEELENAYK